VQRRLRQNREAAQRSRQRKKAYMAALEAEVLFWNRLSNVVVIVLRSVSCPLLR
jgi:bZIP transcription factor